MADWWVVKTKEDALNMGMAIVQGLKEGKGLPPFLNLDLRTDGEDCLIFQGLVLPISQGISRLGEYIWHKKGFINREIKKVELLGHGVSNCGC